MTQSSRPVQLIAQCLLILLCCLTAVTPSRAQTPFTDTVTDELLSQVMPGALRFGEKTGEPPVFPAYRNTENGEEALAGYAFLTADMPPEEVGFSAPINVLVGMDIEGRLTGIKVMDYRESYLSIRGDFLNSRGFQPQFRNKTLDEGFRVGQDINGVSRATISSWAMSRGIHNAARRVARSHLEGVGGAGDGDEALARELLEAMSWQDMLDTGMITPLTITLEDGSQLELAFAYMGREVLGEVLVGTPDYSGAERQLSSRFDSGEMLLVAINGNPSDPFRQERLALQQQERHYPMPRPHFVYAGAATAGKIEGKARFAGALVLDETVDLSQPFTVLYEQDGVHPGENSVQIQLNGIALALALGQPVQDPAQLALDGIDTRAHSGFLLLPNDTDWPRVIALAFLLTLVMVAFLRKSERLRWAALGVTLLYLGFIDGGFLSISHITNGLQLGPSMYLSDLPLLMIIAFTLVTTLLWGRVFCSSLCPFGALQDLLTRITPKRWQRKVPQRIHDRAQLIKYAFLAVILLGAIFFSGVSLFQYVEPFGTLFYFSTSILLWFILLVILLASMVVKRFYCRYLCPLGAALGILSLISPLRIQRVEQCQACKVCEQSCPTGAIRGADIQFHECVRCDICENKLEHRAGVCRHSMEDIRKRHRDWQPVHIKSQADPI